MARAKNSLRFTTPQAKRGPVNITNTATASESGSQIASLGNGTFALTWTSQNNDGTTDLFSATYDVAGNLVAQLFNVTKTPNTPKSTPQILALGDDSYAVTWTASASNGSTDGFVAVFDADGTPIARPLKISNAQDTSQANPHVAGLGDGNYAVTWIGTDAKGNADVFSAVYDVDGTAIAEPFRITSTPNAAEANPRIAALGHGNYAVTWNGMDANVSAGLFTAVYNTDGDPVVAPFSIPHHPECAHIRP
jgi:cytochrome oxidase assembly protein ShyY1